MDDDTREKLDIFEERLLAIENRNSRVSLDKAWETSWTRKASILALTYLAMCLLLGTLGDETPLEHAVVPTLGFFLSTVSLPIIRDRWKSRQRGSD